MAWERAQGGAIVISRDRASWPCSCPVLMWYVKGRVKHGVSAWVRTKGMMLGFLGFATCPVKGTVMIWKRMQISTKYGDESKWESMRKFHKVKAHHYHKNIYLFHSLRMQKFRIIKRLKIKIQGTKMIELEAWILSVNMGAYQKNNTHTITNGRTNSVLKRCKELRMIANERVWWEFGRGLYLYTTRMFGPFNVLDCTLALESVPSNACMSLECALVLSLRSVLAIIWESALNFPRKVRYKENVCQFCEE